MESRTEKLRTVGSSLPLMAANDVPPHQCLCKPTRTGSRLAGSVNLSDTLVLEYEVLRSISR